MNRVIDLNIKEISIVNGGLGKVCALLESTTSEFYGFKSVIQIVGTAIGTYNGLPTRAHYALNSALMVVGYTWGGGFFGKVVADVGYDLFCRE